MGGGGGNWIPGQRSVKALCLEVMQKHGMAPLPPSEIRELVARRRSGVRLPTVVQALQTLAKEGAVKKVKLANRVAFQAREHAWPVEDKGAA